MRKGISVDSLLHRIFESFRIIWLNAHEYCDQASTHAVAVQSVPKSEALVNLIASDGLALCCISAGQTIVTRRPHAATASNLNVSFRGNLHPLLRAIAVSRCSAFQNGRACHLPRFHCGIRSLRYPRQRRPSRIEYGTLKLVFIAQFGSSARRVSFCSSRA